LDHSSVTGNAIDVAATVQAQIRWAHAWRPKRDKPAHASPTDAKRSHHGARLRWVTFWVTQKSHRAKALIAAEFASEVRILSPGHTLLIFQYYKRHYYSFFYLANRYHFRPAL
jgi:hypothetical protein